MDILWNLCIDDINFGKKVMDGELHDQYILQMNYNIFLQLSFSTETIRNV